MFWKFSQLEVISHQASTLHCTGKTSFQLRWSFFSLILGGHFAEKLSAVLAPWGSPRAGRCPVRTWVGRLKRESGQVQIKPLLWCICIYGLEATLARVAVRGSVQIKEDLIGKEAPFCRIHSGKIWTGCKPTQTFSWTPTLTSVTFQHCDCFQLNALSCWF